MRIRSLFVAVTLSMGYFTYAQEIDYKGFSEWTLKKQDSTEYALYTPMNLEAGEKYPVVLFMHGCCGEDYHASLRNAVDPPVRMWHGFGANKQTVPTYIISPKTSQGWKQHFKNLKAAIDDLVANHHGDAQRLYVCGFSMGGEGTFRIIQEYPGYFAAAIPMGMNFSGDSSKVKDIPIWINHGETDWYARKLSKQVAAIRALNGLAGDTGTTWITGVNPRYSNFKGVGHGVQWIAASTQDLTGWAYSKINDGNKYPVVFFEPLESPVLAGTGRPVTLHINASDPDGSISRIEIYLNDTLNATLKKTPYEAVIMPRQGDNKVQAIAFDNQGKNSTANVVVKVNVGPRLLTGVLPGSTAGDSYAVQLGAVGNGRLVFSMENKVNLPGGLRLYPDGTIRGITNDTGSHGLIIRVKDEDGDTTSHAYTIVVGQKKAGEVLVSNIATSGGNKYRLSKMRLGGAPNFSSKDSLLTSDLEEINFSDVSGYDGLSFIQTDSEDAKNASPAFLNFEIDEDAVIYIAYEVLDHKFRSGIPSWLNSFTKEPGQVVAQYRYFNVYSKPYKKGRVVLPGADAATNKVASNYFVMIKKK